MGEGSPYQKPHNASFDTPSPGYFLGKKPGPGSFVVQEVTA
ncbi:hypothetical protein LEP1GSC043_4264 [Leptospira weilii str. Ecochallenge]|uniref:Uncharacterized protein n=1 Tax=Leptospira weilii str. Ecochallenge TaxID=1049986 RepID=N1UK76_9LEPT|nr:hypothetical protein LEP1GSC043_4264 [Leptospira weilii str. Ecochallenge]